MVLHITYFYETCFFSLLMWTTSSHTLKKISTWELSEQRLKGIEIIFYHYLLPAGLVSQGWTLAWDPVLWLTDGNICADVVQTFSPSVEV